MPIRVVIRKKKGLDSTYTEEVAELDDKIEQVPMTEKEVEKVPMAEKEVEKVPKTEKKAEKVPKTEKEVEKAPKTEKKAEKVPKTEKEVEKAPKATKKQTEQDRVMLEKTEAAAMDAIASILMKTNTKSMYMADLGRTVRRQVMGTGKRLHTLLLGHEDRVRIVGVRVELVEEASASKEWCASTESTEWSAASKEWQSACGPSEYYEWAQGGERCARDPMAAKLAAMRELYALHLAQEMYAPRSPFKEWLQ